jgi:segregation and condensation protein A
MQIKAHMLLPQSVMEETEEEFDPRAELTQKLLEYKRFKDVAGDLQSRAEVFSRRFPRSPIIPDKDSLDLEDAEVWDLMAAFNKLMQQTGRTGYQHQIIYDDTPIATHALSIVEQLHKQGGSIEFATIFSGKSRPQCVGMFLALLELIRRARVRADQDRPFGEIYVFLLDSRPLSAPEVAESFGPEGGQVGMAARPEIGADFGEPAADLGPSDLTLAVPEDDGEHRQPFEDGSVVDKQSGAEDDAEGSSETRGNGAELA